MELDSLRDFLDSRLRKPLPGLRAHRRMVPLSRRLQRARLSPGADAAESSVMIIIHPIGAKLHLVLIRRPTYEGVHSGQIAFPGGRRENDDTDALHTAIRETMEEIGVGPDNCPGMKVHGHLTQLYIPPSNFKVLPYVGTCYQLPELKPDPDEVSEIIHIPLMDLYKQESISEMVFLTEYSKVQAPCYVVDGIVVWGATAMMLSELLNILKPWIRRFGFRES